MKSRRQIRLDRLADALGVGRSLHLREAAALLGVSAMTVRRDVASSEGRFHYLGGYIIAEEASSSSLDYFLHREAFTNIEGKKEACRNALTCIDDKDVIFIDCGTTLPFLAQILPDNLSLTVICYSINIAEIVCKRPNLKVIMLGGEYHPASASFSSEEAQTMLGTMGINKAFISAGGLHFQNGLSCSNFHEVRLKQIAMTRALSRIVVMDSTKFDKVKAASFAGPSDFDEIATDSGVLEKHRSALKDLNIILHA
jgi:DeoR family deoxyribose operon repressor